MQANSDYIISIIIPLHNSQLFLEKLICHINSSKIIEDNAEVVLVDDGSSDKTQSIADKLVLKFKNIKYYYKNNGGIASSRNFGISVASANYLFFHDHDDILDVLTFEYLINFLKNTSNQKYELLLFETSKIINDKKYPGVIINKQYDYCELSESDVVEILKARFSVKTRNKILNYFGCIWATIIQKEFALKNDIKFQTILSYEDDANFLLDYILCNPKTFLFKKHLYSWVINRSSFSGSYLLDENFPNRIDDYVNYLSKRISKCTLVQNSIVLNVKYELLKEYLTFLAKNHSKNAFVDFLKIHRNDFIYKLDYPYTLKQRILILLIKLKLYSLSWHLLRK